MHQDVTYEVDQRQVALITLNRAEKHNAFNDAMISTLTHYFEKAAQDSQVRAVVLKAEGKSFSAGADAQWMKKMASYSEQENHADAMKLATMLHTLYSLPKTTIARVQGAAFGGAVGLIACCDIAVAVEGALFSLTEVLLGLLPATISPYVLLRIGPSNARRVMLNAHRFSAEEAVHLGLISKAVSADKLDEAIEKEINELLRCAPEAVSATKRLIAEVRGKEPADVRSATIEKLANAWESESIKEGIDAFFSKRKPAWNPEA